ncbi:MAG: cadherin domain-containing protein, partial [Lyngbya sp.]|nr:cadherin domain-containing protein [Lyngbya sp.]
MAFVKVSGTFDARGPAHLNDQPRPLEFTLLDPVPEKIEGNLIESFDLYIINEKQDVTLPRDIDLFDGFTFENYEPTPNFTIPSGSVVSSHLVFVDPPGTSVNRYEWKGQLEFDEEIIGILPLDRVIRPPISATNDLFTPDGTTYNLGGRGLDNVWDVVSFDGKTLSFLLDAGDGMDVMRVITASNPDSIDIKPIPGAIPTPPLELEPEPEPELLPDNVTRIQAEQMQLSDYEVENGEYASGGKLIKLTATEGNQGTAATTFQGEPGIYTVEVTYFDEGDGESAAAVRINGQEIESWSFNIRGGSGVSNANNSVTRSLATQITLNPGDTIELSGVRNRGEFARFDYIDFKLESQLEPEPQPENQAPSINPASFNIGEDAANSATVGTVTASDEDGDNLTYSITAGNDDGIFGIDDTGKITIADNTKLDYETTTSYDLTVQVSDGSLSESVTVTVNVTDVEEPPTEQPPTEQPPTEQPPTEQPPTEQPPTEQPPTEQPPTEQPPTEQPPTEQPPTEQPPTEQPPTEQPPTEQPPTEQPPTEQPPTEQPPTEQPPTEQPPTEQPPTEQPPT